MGADSASPSGGDACASGSCRAAGCTAPLSTPYERRRHACAAHLRADAVALEGALPGAPPHRFCHQCGKFEPLGAFDGDRRTCRQRLMRRRLGTTGVTLLQQQPPLCHARHTCSATSSDSDALSSETAAAAALPHAKRSRRASDGDVCQSSSSAAWCVAAELAAGLTEAATCPLPQLPEASPAATPSASAAAADSIASTLLFGPLPPAAAACPISSSSALVDEQWAAAGEDKQALLEELVAALFDDDDDDGLAAAASAAAAVGSGGSSDHHHRIAAPAEEALPPVAVLALMAEAAEEARAQRLAQLQARVACVAAQLQELRCTLLQEQACDFGGSSDLLLLSAATGDFDARHALCVRAA